MSADHTMLSVGEGAKSDQAEDQSVKTSTPKIILLVDDDERFLTVLANELTDRIEGSSCLTAKNGEEALKVLESQRVDLVVTDAKMPVMNGLQLVSRMQERYPTIPAIVMSSFLNQEVETSFRAKGVLQCVDKLSIRTIEKVIATLLLSPLAPSGREIG